MVRNCTGGACRRVGSVTASVSISDIETGKLSSFVKN